MGSQRAVKRKIDRRVLPLVIFRYVNYQVNLRHAADYAPNLHYGMNI